MEKSQLVRMLRDLSLYMVETHEEGYRGNTDAMKLIPDPVKAKSARVRRAVNEALHGGAVSVVRDVACAIAKIPVWQKVLEEHAVVREDINQACPVNRPIQMLNPEFDRDLMMYRSCRRYVRYLEMRLFQGHESAWSRLEPFIPERLMPLGLGTLGGAEREHVVPSALLRDRCLKMLNNNVPLEDVARQLPPYLAIVLITNEQRRTIDHTLHLRTRMPPGWKFFDISCIYARLHAAGIAFNNPETGPQCEQRWIAAQQLRGRFAP